LAVKPKVLRLGKDSEVRAFTALFFLPGIGGKKNHDTTGRECQVFTWRYNMSVANVGFNTVSPMLFPEQERTVRQAADQPEKKAKPQIHNSTTAELEKIGLVFNKKLQFVVDHSSHEVIIKVIDKDTDKVIKELPPEELQRLHSNLKEAIGLLFDEMV
jgi:flagellar protein FlaG